MKRIAIIGGGQCGLHLGFGLMDRGYDVSLYNDRTPEQLLGSRIQSTPFLYSETLQMERRLGLNFWEADVPLGEGMFIDFREPTGKSLLTVRGRLHEKSGQALDQRTKFARWMEEFEQRGGNLVIQAVTLRQLDEIAAAHDLTFVASGNGTIDALFERDDEHSIHRGPSRHLAGLLLRGSKLLGDRPWTQVDFRPLRFNFVFGTGEFFSFPSYTHTAAECRSFLFEAKPGGAMDRFQDAADGLELLAIAKQVVRDFAPEDARYLDDAQLTDANAWFKCTFTPTIRKPVGRLPSGRVVMGVGETVVRNDPIAGQGANIASRMADHLIRNMARNDGEKFDANWMQDVFDSFWNESACYATDFTNALLQPPSEAVTQMLGAAAQRASVADQFVGCFENPRNFWPWINDFEDAKNVAPKHSTTKSDLG